MEIYLVRHTLPNVASDICYGQSEIDVAVSFAKDLALVKNKLADIQPAVCFTSPSLRCTKLAEALNAVAVVKDKRLLELNFGDWELQRWDSIERASFDCWAHDHVSQSPPNGETFAQLHGRATEFLSEVSADSTKAKVVVITHAGVIRALLAEILGLSLMNVFRIQIDYGSVTQLLINEQAVCVAYVNR